MPTSVKIITFRQIEFTAGQPIAVCMICILSTRRMVNVLKLVVALAVAGIHGEVQTRKLRYLSSSFGKSMKWRFEW